MSKSNLAQEFHNLDIKAHAGMPGSFIELPDGVVHYELSGRSNNQTVILVHGFSAPSFIWQPTFEALTAAGLRVLRYDIYGRGYSDRPEVVYDFDLFDNQLVNLLTALDIHQPLDLIGLSMGGRIAVVFAARHTSLVRKLGLIDPLCPFMPRPLTARLAQLPGLGEILVNLFGKLIFYSQLPKDFYRPENCPPEFQEKFLHQVKYRGFKRALLSTLRNMGDMPQPYYQVGELGLPVLLIWGRYDHTIPITAIDMLREAIPQAEFHVIEEAGHVPHYEQPGIVNPILIDFLTRGVHKWPTTVS